MKLGVPFSLVLLFAAALVVCGGQAAGTGRLVGKIVGEDWWVSCGGMDRRSYFTQHQTLHPTYSLNFSQIKKKKFI